MKNIKVDIKVDVVQVGKLWRYSVKINSSRFIGKIETKYGYKTAEGANLAGWKVVEKIVWR